MFKPEEIKNITFEQSVFSGYKKEDVDDFLDKVYSEYSRIYNENAELVEKLKVCITKIEEYRQDEKFLKSAIVNAQKLNETAVQEIELKKKETEEIARKQAEDIIAQANAEADRLLTDCNQKIAEVREKSTYEFVRQQNENARSHSEQMREFDAQILSKNAELDNLQKEIDKFKSMVLSVCEKQISLLNTLPEFQKAEEMPAVEEPVAEVETKEEPATSVIVEETTIEEQTEQDLLEESKEDVAAIDLEVEQPVEEVAPIAEEADVEIDEVDKEQISIDEVIAKASPVEPSSPVIAPITDDLPDDEEAEQPFRLFGTSPLVFPQDIAEEEDEVVHTAPSHRGRKKLKFGVDFDVKKDK